MKHIALSLGALSLCVSASALAEVRINGFANLVAGYSDTDSEVFGYDDNVTFSNESLFALQLSADVSDKVTATGQIVARGRDNFEAAFEWAYLTYSVNDALSISAGRLRLPLFLYSESLDVGYSYHWITPPNALYDISFNNIDGVRATYTTYKGGWDWNLNGAYGVISNDNIELSAGTASLESNNAFLVSLEASKDAFKTRLVYGQGESTLSAPTVAPIIASVAQVSPGLADALDFNEDTSQFFGASFGYDNFDWFVAGEYTLINNEDTFSPEDQAYYVTAGYRVGQYTPSITWQKRNGEDDIKFLDQLTPLPVQFQQALLPAVAGLQLSQMENWETITLGVRYDASAGVALKGEFVAYSDNLDPQLDANVFKLAVNYVF